MRPGRASLTAAIVAAARALYAELPAPYRIAPDPRARALVGPILGLPAELARRFPAGAPWLHGAAGGLLLGMPHNVALRTQVIDDALLASVGAGAGQVVLLGAGLDNRPHRLAQLAETRVFEIDAPASLATRQSRMRAGDARGPVVVRVPVDFERDELDDALDAHDFDRSERAFWIWEGVTVYLTHEAIDRTLAAVARASAPGSRIAITYTRPRAGQPVRDALVPAARALLDLMGEPILGVMTPEEMHARLDRAGFAVLEDETSSDWAARYWPDVIAAPWEWERCVVAERS